MHPFLSLVFQVIFMYVLLFCGHEGTSITLSPVGMVSVCSIGQVLLTCEATKSSTRFLHWTISVPHLVTPLKRIVANQGYILSPEFKIGYTEFSITRTSESPLISQLLVNNVTTGINGSNIYCSENNNNDIHNMATINVIHKDDALQNINHSLNTSLVNQLMTSNITIILLWSPEAGAVYQVDVLPETLHTALTKVMNHDTIMINLTISYDTEYNVSIVSSLCGVTTTKVLNYVTCDYPQTELLHGPVVVVTGSDSPTIEGQFITYVCPPGFILIGPNVSVCMGNREWEPHPGEVECIGDCGVPLVNNNVKLNYTSTLDGSVLRLSCENDITNEENFNAICYSNASWIPDPAEFTCSSFTTVLPGLTSELEDVLLIIIIPSITFFTILILLVVTLCACIAIKKYICVAKNTSAEDHSQQPTYEEITQCHKAILMDENTAYGHIIHATKKLSAH